MKATTPSRATPPATERPIMVAFELDGAAGGGVSVGVGVGVMSAFVVTVRVIGWPSSPVVVRVVVLEV